MQAAQSSETYKVWAIDNVVYGPVNLGTLMEWVRDERIVADTWVHDQPANKWRRARELPALKPHLAGASDTVRYALPNGKIDRVTAEEFRHCPVFAGLSNGDLDQFIGFGKLQHAAPGETIVKKGAPCDAAYFLVSGGVRARIMVGFDDKTLSRMAPGEFFGELGMFIQSTRTADILAEAASRLLKFTAETFQLMIREVPQLAAPVLYAMAQAMARRIADDNQKLQHEVAAAFLWR